MAPADGVAHGSAHRSVDVERGLVNDLHPRVAHDEVEKAGVGLHVEVALRRDLSKATEQGRPRHLHIVQHEEAVVHGVVADFRAYVTDLNSWERFMRIHVPDGHNEWHRAVVVTKR